MKKKIVDIGACYRDSDIFWSQWRVERVFADCLGTPHAVVTSMADPTVTRTIACQVLHDRRRYRPIGEEEADWRHSGFVVPPAAPGTDAIHPREDHVAAA